jgi:hypothetical protein
VACETTRRGIADYREPIRMALARIQRSRFPVLRRPQRDGSHSRQAHGVLHRGNILSEVNGSENGRLSNVLEFADRHCL